MVVSAVRRQGKVVVLLYECGASIRNQGLRQVRRIGPAEPCVNNCNQHQPNNQPRFQRKEGWDDQSTCNFFSVCVAFSTRTCSSLRRDPVLPFFGVQQREKPAAAPVGFRFFDENQGRQYRVGLVFDKPLWMCVARRPVISRLAAYFHVSMRPNGPPGPFPLSLNEDVDRPATP